MAAIATTPLRSDDLRDRLANRVLLTSDGHKAYLEAVEAAFGGDIDYAMLIKMFGAAPQPAKGRRPGGFGGDPSIFAPCSLDISRHVKQAVGNKDLQFGENVRLPGRSRQPSSPSGAFQKNVTNRSCGLASPRAILACCGEGRNCGDEKTRRGFPPGHTS